MPMPAQAEMIAQLQAENGPARDAAYIAQQKASQGKALAVQQAYAADGSAPALKMAAAKIVPVVREYRSRVIAFSDQITLRRAISRLRGKCGERSHVGIT
jgi:predicted outer membrane protein